jgi:hypothetical protein
MLKRVQHDKKLGLSRLEAAPTDYSILSFVGAASSRDCFYFKDWIPDLSRE